MSTDVGCTIRSMALRNPSQLVKRLARDLGFDRCGIARAGPISRADYSRTWLEKGFAGTMHYLKRNPEQRLDPRRLLDGAKSVIVVVLSYHQPEPRPPETPGSHGRIARYAWGDDYHKVIKKKLFALADRLRQELFDPFECKACVDTAPLIEREWAAAAGVGWIGKNTLVLDPQLGSYTFLGALVTTLDLPADEPAMDHCGSCRACLDACPTDAFPNAYRMDATRCISYLTIEHRGDIKESLREKMEDWIFGCDVCQEVCPFNRDAAYTREPRFAVRGPAPTVSLDDIKHWTPVDYREQLRGSAMKRATLEMLKRNATIAEANQKNERHRPAPH